MDGELVPFGEACRKIREAKDMSQGDIFRITGLERSYISRFESGRVPYPRLQTVAKIAKALGVTIEEVLKTAVELKKMKRKQREDFVWEKEMWDKLEEGVSK